MTRSNFLFPIFLHHQPSTLFPYTTLFRSTASYVFRFELTGEVVPMNRKGFTLIELLIVVVIIGILAAIAVQKFDNTKEKPYLASMMPELRNLVPAEEAYLADSVKHKPNQG